MSMYSIDSKAQALRATGIVEPVMEWIEDETGKRRQSENQSRHEDTGAFLWAVEVQYLAESFGRQSTVIARVTVPSVTAPAVAAFEIVEFEGLVVEVSLNRKTNALREFWNASGLPGQSQSRKTQQDAA